MQNQSVKFDSSKNKSGVSIFDKIKLSAVLLLAAIIVLLYLYFSGLTAEEGLFGYLSIGVLIFYLIVFLAAGFIDRQAYKIIFDGNTISLYYNSLFKERQKTWPLNSTGIELFELKNHRAQFEGFQINFKNKTEGSKIKLYGERRTYSDFENIYTEFKKRKIERTPGQEAEVFRSLQIISNTADKE